MWRNLAIAAVFSLAGCAGSYVPPAAVSAGFFGATVTLSEPGFTVPAKVVAAPVTAPTLVVPSTSRVTTGNVVVTTETGQIASVPVKTGNVSEPVLAVPSPSTTQ